MGKVKALDQKEHWITCPVCGKRLMKPRIASVEVHCDCGANVTACATKNFVATIIHSDNDDTSMTERLDQYRQEIFKLEQ